MPVQEPASYRFADCELDVRERRLRVRGQAVTLTPKVFDTLVLLVEHAGHVVSKDELMAALWPRGFVHESNLTKHIWLIRRALGDGEDDSRYIETIPKSGYRFIAAVQQVAAGDPAPAPPASAAPATPEDSEVPSGETAASGRRRITGPDAQRRRKVQDMTGPGSSSGPHHHLPSIRLGDQLRLLAIALVLLVLLGGGYWWMQSSRTRAHPPFIADPGAVAIVDFNNLAGNAKDAWLGPALEQMLATELAANGKLHAVSEELVRPASQGLPAPGAGGYSPASLATLQQRLGAHYVMSGGYLVSSGTDVPQLRVDITVQEAGKDSPFATLSRAAAVKDLPALVTGLGADLRQRFGEAPVAAAIVQQLAAAQPPSAEVARHMGFALQALGQYDAARARDELLQAVAQAPGYAPAYLDLSRAWAMLGYRAKAIAAARQADQNATGLPRELQLQIEAQQAALAGDAAKVTQLRSDLVQLRPDNPEYRLRWINTLVVAGRFDTADMAMAKAHTMPAFAGDPRLELAASNLATKRGDHAAAMLHAREALALAQARGAPGLIAEAELQLGVALHSDPKATALLRSAIAGYHRLGNPHGEAKAWQNLGNLQGWLDQQAAERESYQRALTIYQGIGDLGGEAAIYANLSDVLWQAGDRDGTATALRQALAIARETGDVVLQAWTLTGLATVLSDDSASDEAAGMYREAIALDRQAGETGHLAFALSNYADFLRMRGQLDDAAQTCTQAQTNDGKLPVADRSLAAAFECAQIALDRGDVTTAEASLKAIVARALAAKDEFNAANARMVLGQIAMGRGQWVEARAALQQSLAGWTALKEVPGEATSAALLALCADALHDDAARTKLAARARELRSGVTARAEVFELDVALAELQGEAGQPAQALAALDKLSGDATQRQWPGLAFEARLAALRVLQHGADRGAAGKARAALMADARRAGFGWVVQRAASTAKTPRSSAPH